MKEEKIYVAKFRWLAPPVKTWFVSSKAKEHLAPPGAICVRRVSQVDSMNPRDVIYVLPRQSRRARSKMPKLPSGL